MIRNNSHRTISVVAVSATAYASSWLGYQYYSSSNRQYCHCAGISTGNTGSIDDDRSNNNNNTQPTPPPVVILPIRMIRPNDSLEIAFDVRTRTPLYVVEKLNKQNLPKRGEGQGQRRRPNFYEDKNIETEDFRSKLSHYHKSGYDRGHMAPSADFIANLTKDTYTLCNIVPQDPVCNKGIWNVLEEWIRRLVHSDEIAATSTVYVVTGPLWLPKRQVGDGKFEYQHLGLGQPPSLVQVPSHLFKVVIVVNECDPKSLIQFACFVVGNEQNCPSKKLEDYVVAWKDLETVTGLQFFPQWATTEWKEYADQVTTLQVPASIGNNESRIFLTNCQQGRSGKNKNNNFQIKHLCAEGKCR